MNKTRHKTSLVLLSGLLCDDTVWSAIADQLENQVDVRIFSFAGFNSIRAMATHVLGNSPDSFALAGHSMGGRVALEVYQQAPTRVERLALLNTGVHPRTDAEIPGRQRLLDLAANHGMEAVADAWLPPMMSSRGAHNATLMATLKSMVLRHSVEDFQGEIKALLNRPDAQKILPNITVPTLLLSGDEDNWSPISQHQKMQEQIPGSSLEALAGAGHMSTVEAPDTVPQLFRQWLELQPQSEDSL